MEHVDSPTSLCCFFPLFHFCSSLHFSPPPPALSGISGNYIVPGAPPDTVKAYAESSTSLRVAWAPPPESKRNGKITYYKIFYVPNVRSDSEATVVEIKNPDSREFVIDELRKWTEYRIWMLAGTQIGDGPISNPVIMKTDEDGM